MSTPLTIQDLEPGSSVELKAMIQDLSLRTTKTGNSYLALTLQDSTGAIAARIWDEAKRLHALVGSGDAVTVRGLVETFGNHIQLNVKRLEACPWDEETRRLLLPSSRRDTDAMWAELLAAIAGIADPELRTFLETFVESEGIRENFRTAPAAKTVHHAWVGGLLEHTVSMLAVAEALADHYRALVPDLNKDLLLAGVVLHDAGKTIELGGGGGLEYTTRGRLLGHMALAAQMIERHRAAGQPLADETLDRLVHLILSHHGDKEKGSPVSPATAEALLLHHIDMTDSRMAMAARMLDAPGPDGWTRYDRFLGGAMFVNEQSADSSREPVEDPSKLEERSRATVDPAPTPQPTPKPKKPTLF